MQTEITPDWDQLDRELDQIAEYIELLDPHTPYYNLLIDRKLTRLYEINSLSQNVTTPKNKCRLKLVKPM